MTLRVENNGFEYHNVGFCGIHKPVNVNNIEGQFYFDMNRTGSHEDNLELHRDIADECLQDLKGVKIWKYDDFNFEKIGEGVYGTVFKVVHKHTHDVMVLKELKNASDDEHRKMFIDEIKLLNRLRHPNLLKFEGLAVHKACLCFLAEYIEGGCLGDMIGNQDQKLNGWTTRVNIALDIARGMAYLHGEGVIHRDLAAKNILIRPQPSAKLQAIVADLGLSYRIPDFTVGEEYALDIVGSPYHMAPELLHSKPYSIEADIFSFGIILCEIMSGCPGADPDEIPRTQEFGLAVEEFTEIVSDCPSEFLNLAVRCCQLVPSERPSFVDIVKVVDIILDNMQANTDGDRLSVPPAQDRSRVCSMDYMIEPSIACSCGKQIDLPDDDFLGIHMAEDRLGTLQRTASRQLLRQLATRCQDCGGRIISNFDYSQIGQRGGKPVGNGLERTDCLTGIMDDEYKMPGETDGTVRAYQFTAGSLLRQDAEDIVARTTHLAKNTPGRLPKFFHYLLRTKKSRLKPRDHGSGKRKTRKSITDLFTSMSHGSYSQGNNSLGSRETLDKSGHSSCLTSPRSEQSDSVFVPNGSFQDLTRQSCGVEQELYTLSETHQSPAGKGHSTSISVVEGLTPLKPENGALRRHSMPPGKQITQTIKSSETYLTSEKSFESSNDYMSEETVNKKGRSRSIFNLFRRKRQDK